MLIFQGFANSRIVREFPPFSFKVRIATLTRNRLIRKGPWVRIPPSPPEITPVVGFSGCWLFIFHSVQKHGLQELMLYDTATKPEYRSSFCREGDQYDEKAMRTGAFKQSS